MISVVIPTLNEEGNIKRVIKQFEVLNKKDYEVIIGDGGSKDNTRKIARKLGAKVYKTKGRQTIAKNRNTGAEHAKGEIIMFTDADTLLDNPKKYFTRIKTVFQDKNIVAGMTKIHIFPEKRKTIDTIFHFFYNSLLRFGLMINVPMASGQCQIVRRKDFEKVGGYNPKIVFGEDTDLFRKVNKHGKIHYFSDLTILVSPRKYRKIGYIKSLWISLASIFMWFVFRKNYLKTWEYDKVE